ncbi:hypothetical protein TSOC_014089, partial [Tetrabaena socialis]
APSACCHAAPCPPLRPRSWPLAPRVHALPVHPSQVTLSAHCLFHAHLFLATGPARGLGLLLHAAEYPRRHPDTFPYELGHCQEDSPLRPSAQQLARRNLLWYQDRLAVLDVSPGTAARGLLWGETRELCTVYEEDLGRPLADLTLDLPAAPERLMVTPRAMGGGAGAGAGQQLDVRCTC